MKTCGEILTKTLEAYGIDTVFGIPGVHTVELYRGLPDTNIRHITPRHEQGAGFMADGYARSSGKPGACFIVTGPGMTNIATAMGQAMADSVPMLVISAVNFTHQMGMGEGRLHEMPNQQAMMREVSIFSHTLMRADEMPKVLARVFAVFNSERPGPVHIQVPIDIITSPAEHVDSTAWSAPYPPAPAPAAVTLAASWLSAAKRPLIALGGGACDASAEVLSLAEKLGAPVMNTVNAKGVLPYGHPLAIGGSGSCACLREELKNADVVLAVGTEFGETDYDYFFEGNPVVDGKLIRVDINSAQLTRNIKPDLAILSDARLALSAIDSKVTTPESRTGVERAKMLRQAIKVDRSVGYHTFFEVIRSAMPDVIIVGDSTQPTYHAWTHYELTQPRSYFHSCSGFGTLGYAIPAAIGAKLANPHRPVIGLIGDGAAQFTVGELASAVEAQTPVVFLVWNNNGYGEIKNHMRNNGITEIGVNIYTPDFVAIAKGFGCYASKVQSPDELAAELEQAASRLSPSLIEIDEQQFLALCAN